MKKLIYILFIVAYLLPAVGLSVAYHYCGNTLVSARILHNAELKEPPGCCEEEDEEDTCCTDQVVNHKLNVSHFASSKVNLSDISLDYTFIPAPVSLQDSYVKTYYSKSSNSHSPPGIPKYIFIRTLLI